MLKEKVSPILVIVKIIIIQDLQGKVQCIRLETWKYIALSLQSSPWFLGSLLYSYNEYDAELRCMSRLEPELTSEVNT